MNITVDLPCSYRDLENAILAAGRIFGGKDDMVVSVTDNELRISRKVSVKW